MRIESFKHGENVNIISRWNNSRCNNLKVKFCVRTAFISSNQNVYFALWMLNKICYLLVKDDKNITNMAVTGLKTWTFLISLITELPVDSGSKLPTARSACYKWSRHDNSYNLIFGSQGKIFNPMFEKIILKCLNPDLESRSKRLVSTACATMIFWSNEKLC